MVIVNILVFIISLSLVIIIHEFGHFMMARRAGILCHEFALGMGPVVWSKRVGETKYVIKLIPIGGYVMMSGEEIDDEIVELESTVRLEFEDGMVSKIVLDHTNERFQNLEEVVVEKIDLKGVEGTPLYLNEYEVKRDAFYVMKNQELQIAPYDRGFNGKTVWQRFLTLFAGPGMNFVLALVVFLLINLLVGFPKMEEPTIGAIGEGYPSDGILQVGDEVLEIDGVEVSNWSELSSELQSDISRSSVDLTVLRDDQEVDLLVKPIIYFYSIGVHSHKNTGDLLLIGDVTEGTKAYEAGIQAGDQFLSINGVDVYSWENVIDELTNIGSLTLDEQRELGYRVEVMGTKKFLFFEYKAEVEEYTIDISVLRNNEEIVLTIDSPYSTSFLASQNMNLVDSKIGISPEYAFSLGGSIVGSFKNLGTSAMTIFVTLQLLFDSDGAGAGIGVSNLAGPLGIYQITSAALSNGFISLLSWIGLLSVNLGIINLLPIPALDGGRLVFLGFEGLTRRKPNRKFENTLNYVVFLLLMGFFVYVTIQDIGRF